MSYVDQNFQVSRLSVAQFRAFKKDMAILLRIGIAYSEATDLLLKSYESIRQGKKNDKAFAMEAVATKGKW